MRLIKSWLCRPDVAAGSLIALFMLIGALSVRGQSATWDEPLHSAAGLSYWQTGDPRLNADHPPLARLVATVPGWFVPMPRIEEVSPVAWQKANVLAAHYPVLDDIETRLLGYSRLMMLVFPLVLAVLMYRWGCRLFGSRVALLPLSLLVFCPPILANAPIVATDMPVTAALFAAVYWWWRYLDQPTPARLAWVCLAVCAACLVKYSGLLLGPLLLGLGVMVCLRERGGYPGLDLGQLKRVGRAGLIIAVSTLILINLAYLGDGFGLKPADYVTRASGLMQGLQRCAQVVASGWPEWLPIPLPFYYVVGAISQVLHTQGGHFTYFLGEVSNGGWPNYVPLMLLFKLPVPALILMLLGLGLALGRLPAGWRSLMFVLIPPAFILWIVSRGNLQIGFRHLLPALPFMLLLTGYAAEWASRVWRRGVISLLLLINAQSTLSVFPDYLMYFNVLAGGPDQGWRISIEGDDWGQGGAPLVRWLHAHGVRELAFGGFGWSASTLKREGIQTRPVPCSNDGSLVAIHAANLLKPGDLKLFKCYAWMRMQRPDEKIGYSIFLYNTSGMVGNQSSVQRPAPPLDISLFSEALKMQLAGRLDPAIQLYREYLEREPDYYQAHFNLGYALMQQGQYVKAITEFRKTLKLWSGYGETYLHLANCYRAIGENELSLQSEKLYRQANGQRLP